MKETIIPPAAKTIGLSGYKNRKKQTLLSAARHNLRDIQKECGADSHIDATRICFNKILAGPDAPAGIVAIAQSLMDGIGYTPKRKDYTQAHEVLITLPESTTVDAGRFFPFCLDFLVAHFGHDAILSAIVHNDEGAPHLHVLLMPIANGQYVGSALITKPSLAELVDKFAADVLKAFGIIVMTSLRGKDRARAAQMVDKGLRVALDGIASPALLQTILKAAARHPAPFMEALDIRLEDQLDDGGAAFRRIALSKGKGAKKEHDYKPYGFERAQSDDVPKPCGFESGGENHRNHPCVVSPNKPPSPPATKPAPAARRPAPAPVVPIVQLIDPDGVIASPGGMVYANITSNDSPIVETTRVRDSDLDPTLYDSDTGEYFQRPPPAPRRHQQAVNDALSALRGRLG